MIVENLCITSKCSHVLVVLKQFNSSRSSMISDTPITSLYPTQIKSQITPNSIKLYQNPILTLQKKKNNLLASPLLFLIVDGFLLINVGNYNSIKLIFSVLSLTIPVMQKSDLCTGFKLKTNTFQLICRLANQKI